MNSIFNLLKNEYGHEALAWYAIAGLSVTAGVFLLYVGLRIIFPKRTKPEDKWED